VHKVLVTGGGGFVGLAIVRKLRAMNIETTVIGRNRYPAVEELGGRCLVGDIRDRTFVTSAVAGYDTVFHVAAKAGIWGKRESYFSINVGGTENIIKAWQVNGIRALVQTSTPSVVFDGVSIQGGDETLPYSTNPLCHYAASKILAEKRVLAANIEQLRTCAIRPHLVWGPGDTQIIHRLLQRGRDGDLKIVGDGLNKVDISYIDNVADAHILAAQNLGNSGTAAGEAFFISQGEPVVLWQWINELFGRVGVEQVRKKISCQTASRVGWILETVYRLMGSNSEPKMTRFLAEQLAMSHWFSPRKAQEILLYTPRITTRQGMDLLIAWLGQQDAD